MIAGERLHRPREALPRDVAVVDRRRTGNDLGDPDVSGAGSSRSPLTTELAWALGGGAVLLIIALLLHALATRLGLGGLTVYGEQFAGLFVAGALGTFVGREFVVTPR